MLRKSFDIPLREDLLFQDQEHIKASHAYLVGKKLACCLPALLESYKKNSDNQFDFSSNFKVIKPINLNKELKSFSVRNSTMTFDGVILAEGDVIDFCKSCEGYKCIGFFIDKVRTNGIVDFMNYNSIVARLMIKYRLKLDGSSLNTSYFLKQFTPLRDGISSTQTIKIKSLNEMSCGSDVNIYDSQWNFPNDQVDTNYC